MSHRAAFAAIGLAAAIGAAPAQAAQTAKLEYRCKWPVIGTQPVTVDLSANLPAAFAKHTSSTSFGYTAKVTLGGDTAEGLSLIAGLKRLVQVNVPGDDAKGNGFQLRADRPDGTSETSVVPLYPKPFDVVAPIPDPIVLDAAGPGIPLTLDQNGEWAFVVSELLLNFRALDENGEPVPGFQTPGTGPLGEPVTDADNDPTSATIPCKLNEDASDQVLGQITVTDGPTKVTGVTASNVTETSAELSWNPSSDPDGTVAGYRVISSNGGSSSVLGTTTGTSIKLENLSPDTFYSLYVVAFDDQGASSLADLSSFVNFKTKRRNGDANLTYRCKFPLAGTSYVSLGVDTDLPATWQAGQPTAAGPVSAKLFLDVNGTALQLGPETGPFRMESVTDAEKPGKGSALGLTAGFADGTSAGVRIQLGAAPYEQQLPSWEYLSLDFTGTAPPIVFPAAGTSTFDATSLTLNLRAVRPDGTPVPGFVTPPTDIARNPYEDIDGDPTTANVPCVLEPQISQRLATTEVTPGTTPGSITYAYDLKGSTQIKTLTKGTLPLSGSIAAQLTLATGAFTADLTLNDTSGRLVAAGFLPVTAKIGFAPSGKTTGTLVDGVLKTNSKVRIKVKEIKLFGAIPLAGGNNCQTKSLSDINLQSTQDEFSPLVGGPIAGTYKISDLNGCGPLNGLVSPLTAGAGNTIALNLTPKP